MAFDYILRKVKEESGNRNAAGTALTYLIDKINEAAREVYRRKDLPILLQECYVRTTSNAELALPPFIGELRAIRSTTWDDHWSLFDIRPRYNSAEWPNVWKNFRIKAYAPLAVELTNGAPGTITIEEADSELELTFVGETETSNRIANTITMDATSKTWTSTFTNIRAIRKNKVTDHNIYVSDADGNQLAVIYADQLEARYVIVDVSAYPNLIDCGDEFNMEVLYKPGLGRMERDYDFFPVDGFDDVIVLKTLELLTSGKEGQEQRAFLMSEKGKELVDDIVSDKTGTIEKKIFFKPNPLLGLSRRYNRYR